MGGSLRAGWAGACITPEGSVPMGGYGARTAGSRGVHDPLEARVLSLSDGRARAIIVVVDVLLADEELVRDVRAGVTAGLEGDAAAVWLVATHTHGGPDLGGLRRPRANFAELRRRMADRLIAVAIEAAGRERPVTVRWASGPVEGIAGNRDHPEVDTEIALDLLLLYEEGSDTPAAVFGSLPVHPTVLGADNLQLTADLPGAFRRGMEGATPWVALATGAAGDVSTRHLRQGQDFNELERLGALLAHRARELIEQSRPLIASTEQVELAWLSQRVHLEAKAVPSERVLDERELALRAAWSAAQAAGDTTQARTLETALQGVALARTPAGQGETLSSRAEVGALRVGPLGIVAIPGELYSALGTALRRTTGRPVLVLGYANGYIGYLPTEVAYGRDDYEVLASRLEAGSAERLTEEAALQLGLLFGRVGHDLPSAYHAEIARRLQNIPRYQYGAIRLAGSWIADTISTGRMVFTLGTGHSYLLAEEIFSRAAGLLPVQPIGTAPLTLHENAIASSEWEKLPGAARILLEYSGIGPEDLLIVMSNSGRNAVPVEAAEWAAERGIRTIVLTSVRHSSSTPSLAPSGRRLLEVADLVLDNLGRPGDTLVESANGLEAGASSTVLGAFILQSAVLAAIEELERRGIDVPALRSMNVPGAGESNERSISSYTGLLPHEYDLVRQKQRRREAEDCET